MEDGDRHRGSGLLTDGSRCPRTAGLHSRTMIWPGPVPRIGDQTSAGARLLYLVRHGESTWNVARRVQGQHGEPPLTERGRRQARELAERLWGSGAVQLLASDAVRARQSADIIGHALRLQVRTTPLLRERHWGSFQGQPLADAYRAEASLGDDEPLPGGESRADVRARLLRLVQEELTPVATRPWVWVTHGDVVAEAVRLWGHPGPTDALPGNGSVTVLRIPVLGEGSGETCDTPGQASRARASVRGCDES